MESEVGGQGQLPGLTSDLRSDGEGASPLGCKLPGPKAKGKVLGRQPDLLSNSQLSITSPGVLMSLHPGGSCLLQVLHLAVNSLALFQRHLGNWAT